MMQTASIKQLSMSRGKLSMKGMIGSVV